MNNIHTVEKYLQNPISRRETIREDEIDNYLSSEKERAVSQGNQEVAKHIWCLEAILRIQNRFRQAFWDMKSRYFYSAWCLLEMVEIDLHFLSRHFDFNSDDNDVYCLKFIDKHVQQYQELFPYTMFISPGFIIYEKECNICGKPVSIRNRCGHSVGEVYDGIMCSRRVTKCEVAEISVVHSPVQKYSVVFTDGTDQYNYNVVQYVISGLSYPFDGWDVRTITHMIPRADLTNIGRNEECPCGSGKKYKRCCIKKSGIEKEKHEIAFWNPVLHHPAQPDEMIYGRLK